MLMFDAVLSAPHMPPGIGPLGLSFVFVVIEANDSQHLLNPAAAATFKATAENAPSEPLDILRLCHSLLKCR
jgi:hypothetical protein